MCNADYDHPEIYRESRPRAKKNYKCYECGRVIEKGERHQYVFAVDYGSRKPWTCRTCIYCVEPQTWLLKECGGFLHGGLWEDIIEHARAYQKIFLYRWAIGIQEQWKRKIKMSI